MRLFYHMFVKISIENGKFISIHDKNFHQRRLIKTHSPAYEPSTSNIML